MINNHSSPFLHLCEDEIEFSAIRASGPGGQHVNKVSSAIYCRLNIHTSSLPQEVKQRLMQIRDKRISDDGVIHIKAQRFRSQDRNRQDALERLQEMVERATHKPKRRLPTRPSQAQKRKRLQAKTRRGEVKRLRGNRGIDAGD